MFEYLMTPAELREKAAEKLGPMDHGTYESYKARGEKRAQELGISLPLLGIDIELREPNEMGVTEQAHPITSAGEWVIFLNDARTMCTRMPDVYLVDGSKYSLPI